MMNESYFPIREGYVPNCSKNFGAVLFVYMSEFPEIEPARLRIFRISSLYGQKNFYDRSSPKNFTSFGLFLVGFFST